MKVEFKTPAIAALSLFVVAVTQNLVQPCWLLIFPGFMKHYVRK